MTVTLVVLYSPGTITFQAIANARYDQGDVMVVTVNATDGEGSRKNKFFVWQAKSAQSTWAYQNRSYVPNPPPHLETLNDMSVVVQDHLVGTSHATAFKEVSDKPFE